MRVVPSLRLVLGIFIVLPFHTCSVRAQEAIKVPKVIPGFGPTLAATTDFFYTLVGGVEQATLSSKPSVTNAFARAYFQSPRTPSLDARLWGSVRLLGAPNQTDTQGIYSVFADPTGQITATKLASVGAAVDFAVGAAYRLHTSADWRNSADVILAFGATSPFQSDAVTQAFTVPAFGTAECNILFKKLATNLQDPTVAALYSIGQSKTGVATGTKTACLVNQNAASVDATTGVSTFAPINTVAFSNLDRTSLLLKDLVGLRLSRTEGVVDPKTTPDKGFLGTVDLTFGHDSAITGGVLRGNRWIFKADGLYPIIVRDVATIYVFGSFATRISRNVTDNSPLVLQPAALTTVTGTGTTAVPNVNTVVLPLHQPDRDFYRVGVGIDLVSLFKPKKT